MHQGHGLIPCQTLSVEIQQLEGVASEGGLSYHGRSVEGCAGIHMNTRLLCVYVCFYYMAGVWHSTNLELLSVQEQTGIEYSNM